MPLLQSIRMRLLRHRETVLWFAIAFAVYWLATHHRPIKDKHYVYMADAFLHGSLSVPNPPTNLVEVINYKGGNYFGYGVMPALVLMPFVALRGLAFDPGLLTLAIGAVNVALVFIILRKLQYDPVACRWLTLLFAFGTVHFHAAIWATTWFFMQIVAVFFLLLAINETLGNSCAFLIGLWLGAAVLSRNAVLFAAPFFLILINGTGYSPRRTAAFAAGLLLMLSANGWYNAARFGSVFESGYGKVFTGEYGLFSLHYLKHNLYTYLAMPPEWLGRFPYLKPSLHGMSLFLTTPAFLALFWAFKRTPVIVAAWLAAIGVGLLYLFYFWDGFAQFGVRYTLDYTPFLIILAAAGMSKMNPKFRTALIVSSVAINLWGVVWWRLGHANLV